MAQSQKMPKSPLVVPSSIANLIEAFSTDSEMSAKSLIVQTAAAIYFDNDSDSCVKPLSKDEIDQVYGLMKGIKPANALESIYAAQIVAGHMLGMQKLAQIFQDDQKLGLKLLHLSNDALERLRKIRFNGE